MQTVTIKGLVRVRYLQYPNDFGAAHSVVKSRQPDSLTS